MTVTNNKDVKTKVAINKEKVPTKEIRTKKGDVADNNANGKVYKNQEYRKFVIKNFRNLGVEEEAVLELNRSLKKEYIGDVIYLVGPNNSGKSNVVDAIRACGNGGTEERDVSDLLQDKEDPKLSFIINGSKENYVFNEKNYIENKKTKPEKELEISIEAQLKNITNNGNRTTNFIGLRGVWESISFENLAKVIRNAINKRTHMKLLKNGKMNASYNEYSVYLNAISNMCRNVLGGSNIDNHGVPFFAAINELYGEAAKNGLLTENKTEKYFSETFSEKYGFQHLPNIISYRQESIGQGDLQCDPKAPNRFISNVLRVMGSDKEKLIDSHKTSTERKESGIRKKFEEALNRDVEEKICKRFNDLYRCSDHGKYAFEFRFEREEFSLVLSQGGRPINLDRQSTGFKWFFDFYFNFICTGELEHGDIILMDEPGTNLHASGQKELRKYLKEFAKEQGLTFVICTHSPFLIDCDHLDEVRTMIRDDKTGCVTIRNKFTVLGEGEMDTLDPILRGLTVGRHILTDPKQKVIFVEGITDYCYLTAFKFLFRPKYDGLTFMPIDGIKRKDLFEALLRIDPHPTLLVDADNLGRSVKERSAGKGVEVICLDEVGNSGYKEIEQLFTDEDLDKFNLHNKEWDLASVFKNNVLENADNISEATKGRFNELLDRLLD